MKVHLLWLENTRRKADTRAACAAPQNFGPGGGGTDTLVLGLSSHLESSGKYPVITMRSYDEKCSNFTRLSGEFLRNMLQMLLLRTLYALIWRAYSQNIHISAIRAEALHYKHIEYSHFSPFSRLALHAK